MTASVGKLLGKPDELDTADTTIVIYATDNSVKAFLCSRARKTKAGKGAPEGEIARDETSGPVDRALGGRIRASVNNGLPVNDSSGDPGPCGTRWTSPVIVRPLVNHEGGTVNIEHLLIQIDVRR